MTGPAVIDRIQALIDHDYSLSAWCGPCNRHVKLDLQQLGQQLGFDHSTMHADLTHKLKCENCQRKCTGITICYDDPRHRDANPMAHSSN